MAAARADMGRFVVFFIVGAFVGLLVGEIAVRIIPALTF